MMNYNEAQQPSTEQSIDDNQQPTSPNDDQNTGHDSSFDETAKRLHHKLFSDMEISPKGSGKQCNICIGDLIKLFISSFPGGNRQSQIDQIAQDLRKEYDEPAPTSEDNAQYADTIDWLNDDETFGDERTIASAILPMLFYAEAMQMFNTKLDYWAYLITRYVKGKGFLMDEHLAKVWVCSQLTNIIRNLSEEQAGIALGTGHTLTNIAKAGGTSQPNVKTKWPHIHDYADAYKALKETGEAQDVIIDNRAYVFAPASDESYRKRAESIIDGHNAERLRD